MKKQDAIKRLQEMIDSDNNPKNISELKQISSDMIMLAVVKAFINTTVTEKEWDNIYQHTRAMVE